MSLRPILTWPHEALSRPCAPVRRIDAGVRDLAADMLETMYAAPGRGLAAPQVNAACRMFVMDSRWTHGDPDPRVVINPGLTPLTEQTAVMDEGCLSIPGVLATVVRPARVRMVWVDLDGARHEEEFAGFDAALVQHEVDHLDGIVTFDRLSSEDRVAALKAYGG